jgi:hypothetical protein
MSVAVWYRYLTRRDGIMGIAKPSAVIGIGLPGELVIRAFGELYREVFASTSTNDVASVFTMLIRANERSYLADDSLLSYCRVLNLRPLLGERLYDQVDAINSGTERRSGYNHTTADFRSMISESQDYLRGAFEQLTLSGQIRVLESLIDDAYMASLYDGDKVRVSIVGASCDVLCEAIADVLVEYIYHYLESRYGYDVKRSGPCIHMHLFTPEVFFDCITSATLRQSLRRKGERVMRAMESLERDVNVHSIGFTNFEGKRLATAEDYCRSIGYGLCIQARLQKSGATRPKSESTSFGACAVRYPFEQIKEYLSLGIVKDEIARWSFAEDLWSAGGWEVYGYGHHDKGKFYLDCLRNGQVDERLVQNVAIDCKLIIQQAKECLRRLLAVADSAVPQVTHLPEIETLSMDTRNEETVGILAKQLSETNRTKEELALLPSLRRVIADLHPVLARGLIYACEIQVTKCLESLERRIWSIQRSIMRTPDQRSLDRIKKALVMTSVRISFVRCFLRQVAYWRETVEALFDDARELEEDLAAHMQRIETACRSLPGNTLQTACASKQDLELRLMKGVSDLRFVYADQIRSSQLFPRGTYTSQIDECKGSESLRQNLLSILTATGSHCAMVIGEIASIGVTQSKNPGPSVEFAMRNAVRLAKPLGSAPVTKNQVVRTTVIVPASMEDWAAACECDDVVVDRAMDETWLVVYEESVI